jgi:hypothetical protein
MKRWFLRIVLLLVVFAAGAYLPRLAVSKLAGPVPVGSPTSCPDGPGWIDLLSAENAPHWKNVTSDKDCFRIENGQMHILGSVIMQHMAYMKESYGDFELHVEFKVSEGANSGVFVRSDPENPVYRGMEIQVLDDHGRPPNKNGSGALYDVATPMWNMARPAGEWNSYDITCRGSQLSTVVNGWKVLDIDLSKLADRVGKFPTPLAQLPPRGHILLQDHGAEVWYRCVKVRPL